MGQVSLVSERSILVEAKKQVIFSLVAQESGSGVWEIFSFCLVEDSHDILKLQVIWLSLQHWITLLKGNQIWIQSNNMTAMVFINHQGKT